ncbi:MAG: hypothetical protein RSA53_01015 [Odoribacter sp.]
MAIFKSLLLGKIHNSVANLCMYERDGVNIVRGLPLKVHDAQTPVQLAQRARMKMLRHLTRILEGVVKKGYPSASLLQAGNGFVKRNMKQMVVDEKYQVSYDPRLLRLSSGELNPPEVSASFDRESGCVTFVQQRQALKPLAPDDDRVYGIVWVTNDCKYQIVPLKLRGEAASSVVPIAPSILKNEFQVYAFTVSANGRKTSETVWLCEGKGGCS